MMRYRNVNSGALVSVRDDKVLGSEWETYDGESSSSEDSGYAGMKVADLKAELERRNADRDEESQIEVEGTGKNGAVLGKDIAAALEADDAASSDDA